MMLLEDEIIQFLKDNDIHYVLTLPCAKIKQLLDKASRSFYHIPLSREEEGVGIATGLFLGGKRSAMLIQSGGIGNSLNALLSLAQVYRIPIPIIISWRGIFEEKIEAQIPMGKYLPELFSACELPFVEIHTKEDLPKIEKAIKDCFSLNLPYGIFISPEFWLQSKSSVDEPSDSKQLERKITITYPKSETTLISPELTRFEALEALKSYLKDKFVLSNIGIPSKELYHLLDQPSNFYMLGSLGMVSAIGFGVALTTEAEIIVIDGDASFLMNPNIFGTITSHQEDCRNLTILLMDNGVCGSTGNQQTASYKELDLEIIANAFGMQKSTKARTSSDIIASCKNLPFGPRLIHCIIKPGNKKEVTVIPLSAEDIKKRFMKSLQKS
ncbi:MAG: sulfopyruvate decarboxylase subunit alpha [Asgard group archaeon]|nr:sulfopyruvate decarboxylase subunit alpha [Asgard group archaeon]